MHGYVDMSQPNLRPVAHFTTTRPMPGQFKMDQLILK